MPPKKPRMTGNILYSDKRKAEEIITKNKKKLKW
jgi:hypothetical protein